MQWLSRIPVISKENSLKLEANVFNDIIKETVFCTAPNDQRPILEGVNFSLSNKILTATATDSYRLSRRQVTLMMKIVVKSLI